MIALFIPASCSTVKNYAIGNQILGFSELSSSIALDTHFAVFTILTPEKIKHIQSVDPALLFFMLQYEDITEVYKNEIFKVPQPTTRQVTNWIPTREEPSDPTTYTPVQQKTYNKLLELKDAKN